ncbi:MAG: ABC transporter substrate-binding protein [bacterium]
MKKIAFLFSLLFLITGINFKISLANNGEINIATPFGFSTVNLDPAQGWNGWYCNEAGITETLFMLDRDMNLKPLLAESYNNISPNIWAVSLKKNIKFHDGSPVTTETVKWSIERIIHKESKYFNERIQNFLDIKSIKLIDDYTVQFETISPNAPFIYYLAEPGTGIISPSGTDDKIYGTGPFMVENLKPKEELTVIRNTQYWGDAPKFSRVHFKYVTNPQTRMLAFESGQVDMAFSFPENDVKRLKSNKDMNSIYSPTNRLCFFFVQTKSGPLKSPLIRKALNYAIDRQEIVNTVLAEIGGEAAYSIYPRYSIWSNKNLSPYCYDPNLARQLLKKADVKDKNKDGLLELDDKPIVLNMWTYESRPALKLTLELIQDQLKRIGIASKIRITQNSTSINEAMKKGEVDLNLQMWNVLPQGDPHSFVSSIFISDSEMNIMGYKNNELEAIIKKGKTSFDLQKRRDIYNRIQKIANEDLPVIPLFHKSMVVAMHNNIKNFRIHPAEFYLLNSMISIDIFPK